MAAWMPFYWGDYFKKTLHLSTEEHGAYLLLIGAYWEGGKPLVDDDQYLASIAKLSKFRWKNFREKLSQFFTVRDGFWHHDRVELELLKSSDRQAAAIANGRAGGLAKAKLSTTTSTKKKEDNILSFNGGLGKNGKVTIKDPGERLARFQKWLADSLGGPQGWVLVEEAADPTKQNHLASLAFCKAETKRLGKGWPHQWPKG